MVMMPIESDVKEPKGVTRPMTSVLAMLAGLVRLIPHLWNFTPVGALGLFGGARLRSWHAFALPLLIMLATDAVLAALRGPEYREYLASPMPFFVYVSLLVNVVIGRTLVRTQSPWRIGTASLLASAQFFLVTNFAQWLAFGVAPGTAGTLQPGQYPRDLPGLLACYVGGLPFFGATLLGDLVFSGIFFGLHAALARSWFPAERVGALASSR